jgi:hypothetical protein
VLLMLDNFGDFTDAYRGSEANLKAYEDNKALPRVDHAQSRPTARSSAPFGHDTIVGG